MKPSNNNLYFIRSLENEIKPVVIITLILYPNLLADCNRVLSSTPCPIKNAGVPNQLFVS